jgi:hypothetical protein
MDAVAGLASATGPATAGMDAVAAQIPVIWALPRGQLTWLAAFAGLTAAMRHESRVSARAPMSFR